MADEARKHGLTIGEWAGIVSILISLFISAAAGFLSWGANSARVESLNATVVSLNSTVVTLNQTLQQTREQLARIEQNSSNTDKSLSDLKSNVDYIRELYDKGRR